MPADTTLPLLSQVLGCNSSTSPPSQHSILSAFKGMQCAVASTSRADTDAAQLLQVHDSDILRGGSCEYGPEPITCSTEWQQVCGLACACKCCQRLSSLLALLVLSLQSPVSNGYIAEEPLIRSALHLICRLQATARSGNCHPSPGSTGGHCNSVRPRQCSPGCASSRARV